MNSSACPGFHSAEKFSRRTLLKVRGLGLLDLTLPKWLSAEAACFRQRDVSTVIT